MPREVLCYKLALEVETFRFLDDNSVSLLIPLVLEVLGNICLLLGILLFLFIEELDPKAVPGLEFSKLP